MFDFLLFPRIIGLYLVFFSSMGYDFRILTLLSARGEECHIINAKDLRPPHTEVLSLLNRNIEGKST